MGSARRKTALKKSTVIKICVIVAVVLALGTVAVLMLQSRVSEQFGSNKEQVKTAQVTVGSISTTVTGSGTLANQESEDTFISGTVEVNEVYVNAGDNVSKGDMLASVNSASVVKAMKEVQDSIDSIDEKIGALTGEDISDSITAGVDGRVKKVYAAVGDSIADVMYDKGALMLLSVDGYLSVDVKTDALAAGDTVTVKVDGGSEYDGTVEGAWGGTATVLVADDEAPFGAKASIFKNGSEVGSGQLAIHEQVAVTGFTGKVSSLGVSEGDYVNSGATLLTLEDASNTVNYATLLEQRADLEEQLHDLIVINKEGAVYAQANGMITAISETEDSTTTTTTAVTSSSAKTGRTSGSGSTASAAATSSDTKNNGTSTTVTENADAEDGTTISICPTDTMSVEFNVDETDVGALAIGQDAKVTISALGDEAYDAKVTDLDTVGTSTDGVTTYTATLTLNKAKGMLEGMSASVTIIIEGKEGALLVPVDAVTKTSSTAYVHTSYDESSKELKDMVEVVCGLSNDEYIEISSGLSEGDTVYYTEAAEDERSNYSGPGFGGPSMGGPNGGGPSGRSGGGPGGGGNRQSRQN